MSDSHGRADSNSIARRFASRRAKTAPAKGLQKNRQVQLVRPVALRPAGQKQPPHGKLHAAAVLILLNLQEKLLHVLDSVLEAVLFLQLLDGRLAVLDEGGSVDGSAVVCLLVVLNDLLQLCPARWPLPGQRCRGS